MSDEQSSQRRRFTGQQKVAILREHLIEKVPISEVCQKHGLYPTDFYHWQKQFFENGAAVFDAGPSNGDPQGRRVKDLEGRIQALDAKLARKNEVIAELMEDNVRQKKSLGGI